MTGLTLLIFTAEEQRYALRVEQVDEVLPMAWLTRVAESPADVCGLLDVRGAPVAVVDPALRLGGTLRPPRAADFLVLARAGDTPVALRVDALDGLATLELEPPPAAAEGPPFVAGYAHHQGALVTLLDLEVFLRPEVRAFAEAAQRPTAAGPPA